MDRLDEEALSEASGFRSSVVEREPEDPGFSRESAPARGWPVFAGSGEAFDSPGFGPLTVGFAAPGRPFAPSAGAPPDAFGVALLEPELAA